MKCKTTTQSKQKGPQATTDYRHSADDAHSKPDWILMLSSDEQVKAVVLMEQVIEDLPSGTDEPNILNEIRMRLRVEQFESMMEGYKALSPSILQAKGKVANVVAKGYDAREVCITQDILCLAYAISNGNTAEMEGLAKILLAELNGRTDRRMRQYQDTIKAVVSLNCDVMTDEQMKNRVGMYLSANSTNTRQQSVALLEHMYETMTEMSTSICSIHRRIDGLRENGKVGKRIGPEEKRKIYEIWNEWKKKITPYGRKTYKKDVWENETCQRKLRALGVNNLREFKNAINAHEKTLAKVKLKKNQSRG